MQRKRGGLIPIGEALADLPGPIQAIREASPQARHHFTLADQVNHHRTDRGQLGEVFNHLAKRVGERVP